MAKKVNLPKSTLRKKRKKQLVFKVVCVTLCVIVIFFVFVGLSWLPYVNITTTEIVGSRTVSVDSVQQVVESKLAGSYWHLFSKRNIFIYPKQALDADLLHSYPMFKEVAVHTVSTRTLGVAVVERQPVALWCGIVVSSTTSCDLLDQEGVVYAPAVVYSGDAYVKYFGRLSSSTLPQSYLAQDDFHRLLSLVDAVGKKISMAPQTISVNEAGDVQIVFTGDFSLLITLDAEGDDVLNRLSLALVADPFSTTQLSAFQYLDLRFGKKMYYKQKNTNTVATTSKHS